MKRWMFLLVAVLFLTGCSGKKGFERYTEMIHTFNTYNNYRIEEHHNGSVSTYDYTDDAIHFADADNDIYCVMEDGTMYLAVYDKEHNIYIRQEADYDEHYFHPFELSERLNKLGGYVNMGELIWRDGAFRGDSFSGAYIYKNEQHKPLEIKIEVQDGALIYLYERYEKDGEECVDEVRISRHGINQVDLPLNLVDASYLEELQNLQESGKQ